MKRFLLGTVDVTPAASSQLDASNMALESLLARHQAGDWGDVDAFTQRMNDRHPTNAEPVSSIYELQDGNQVRIITSPDRSLTRVLLAEEVERREVGALEGYDAWAPIYDRGTNPLVEAEQPHVDALLANLTFSSALDVGTGTGRHALKLAQSSCHVVGVDQSPEMLAVARRKANQANLPINLVRASLDAALPFASQQFDFLICALVLTHVAELAEVMREFYRVICPGGYVLITDFHPDAVLKLGWRTSCGVQPGVTFTLPNQPYTRSDYLDAITGAGFTLTKVTDVLAGELPEANFPVLVREFGDAPFCLIALAQR